MRILLVFLFSIFFIGSINENAFPRFLKRETPIISIPTARPTVSEQTKANLQKLKTDLTNIAGKAQVPKEEVNTFAEDLYQSLEGAKKPPQEDVTKLATDLSNALADKKVTPDDAAKLVDDMQKIMSDIGLTQEEITTLKTDIENILKATNVTSEDITLIMEDIKKCIKESKIPEVKSKIKEKFVPQNQ